MSDTYGAEPPLRSPPQAIGGEAALTPGAPDNGPWAPYRPPVEAAPPPAEKTSPVGEAGPWAAYKPPEQPATEKREQSFGESTARGIANSVTFGMAPAIAGLAEASGMPSSAETPSSIDINPMRPIVGAAKLLHQWLSDHPDPKVVEAYHKGREAFRQEDQNAADQHFGPYMAGQLIGALAIPIPGVGPGKITKAITSGVTGGGIYGAGDSISQGNDPKTVAKDALKMGVTGGAVGGAVGAATHGVAHVGERVASVIRGTGNGEREATRRVGAAVRDAIDNTSGPTPRQQRVAREAGTPMAGADLGDSTRALARVSADTSPVAGEKLRDFAGGRFGSQSERFATWLRGKIGGRDTEGVILDLQSAARKANAPLYRRAHAVADTKYPGGIWTPELERLMGSDAVPEAAKAAAGRGRNRAVAEGMGAFNPKVTFNGGQLKIDSGKGVLTYPDLKFWDLTHRELSDAVSEAFRKGSKEQGAAMRDLHRQLLAELDRLVPEFSNARGTAAAFFKATDAADAGAKFVTENVNPASAARVLAKMSSAERQLFRVGFMSELADRISRTGDRVNVINSAFVKSDASRRKILAALGPAEARDLEALLLVEANAHHLHWWLGGSQTSRNFTHALGTGTAIGLLESAKEGDFSPKSVMIGMALHHGATKALAKVDARVADKVAEMLLSKDPAVFQKALATVTKTPTLMNALRYGAHTTGQVGARDVGPDRAAAGAATAAHNVMNAAHSDHGGHHDADPIASQIDANQ